MYIFKHALLRLLVGMAVADDVDSESSSSLRGGLGRFLADNIKTIPDTDTNTNAIDTNEMYDDAPSSTSSSSSRKLATVGCYERKYVSGISYGPGTLVSAKVSDALISYPTWTRDPVSGAWVSANVDTTSETYTYYNYKCNDDTIWCGSSGYGPNEAGESLAWTKLEECNPSLEPPEEDCPLFVLGCPITFDDTIDKYDGGEIVEYDGRVYQCAAAPQDVFCSMDGK